MRKNLLIRIGVLALALASAPSGWAEESMSSLDDERLQSRIALGTLVSPGLADSFGSDTLPRIGSLSFIGDYYLGPKVGNSLRQPAPAGLRATTGLMLGKRSSLWGLPTSSVALIGDRRGGASDVWSDTGSSSTPYLGIGYTGSVSKSSWGFTADLGVMSLSPGSIVRFGRVFNGSQNLDDMVRDLRLSPVLQLGISYSF